MSYTLEIILQSGLDKARVHSCLYKNYSKRCTLLYGENKREICVRKKTELVLVDRVAAHTSNCLRP